MEAELIARDVHLSIIYGWDLMERVSIRLEFYCYRELLLTDLRDGDKFMWVCFQ